MYKILCTRSAASVFGFSEKYMQHGGVEETFDTREAAQARIDGLKHRSPNVSYCVVPSTDKILDKREVPNV